MKQQERMNIALFRYGLISNLVSRQLGKGELAQSLRLISSQEHIHPNGKKQKVGIRTLERYIQMYRQGGFDALLPVERSNYAPRAIPDEALTKAIQLKMERPERSIQQIIRILELAKIIKKGEISESTLSKQLRKRELTRKKLKGTRTSTYRRFEFPYRNACWQGDVQHTLYLPDPKQPEKRILAKLFAFMDDFSRLIVHGEFYLKERGPQLEDCLQKAMLRNGKPEKLYVDNGAIYRAEVLELACARLGIQLVHSKAGRPEGRGKIERFFQFVDSSFKPEAYDLIYAGKIQSLDQLNHYFQIWLDSFYHERRHGETKQPPKIRFEDNEHPLLFPSIEEIKEAFLWEEIRKVDKTGCISFQGNRYEVEQSLVGREITVRFNPFELEHLQIWFDTKRYKDALPLEVHRNIDRRIEKEDEKEVPSSSGLNFLELTEPQHEQRRKEQLGKMSYSKLMGGNKHD